MADALGIKVVDIMSTQVNADGSVTVVLSVAGYDAELIRSGVEDELERSGEYEGLQEEVKVGAGTGGGPETKESGDVGASGLVDGMLDALQDRVYLGGAIGVVCVGDVLCVVRVAALQEEL